MFGGWGSTKALPMPMSFLMWSNHVSKSASSFSPLALHGWKEAASSGPAVLRPSPGPFFAFFFLFVDILLLPLLQGQPIALLE